jgi:hypothetical protein
MFSINIIKPRKNRFANCKSTLSHIAIPDKERKPTDRQTHCRAVSTNQTTKLLIRQTHCRDVSTLKSNLTSQTAKLPNFLAPQLPSFPHAWALATLRGMEGCARMVAWRLNQPPNYQTTELPCSKPERRTTVRSLQTKPPHFLTSSPPYFLTAPKGAEN